MGSRSRAKNWVDGHKKRDNSPNARNWRKFLGKANLSDSFRYQVERNMAAAKVEVLKEEVVKK